MLRQARSAVLAAVLAPAALLAGCAGNEAGLGATVDTSTPRSYNGPLCPAIVVQSGAEAHIVYNRSNTTDPGRVRYQVGILDVARTCSVLDDVLSVTFEVNGRIVAGPAGNGGSVSDTVRVAIVADGGTVLTSRDYTVSANIGAPAFGGNFGVTDTLVVPPTGTAGAFRVVVGVDQN